MTRRLATALLALATILLATAPAAAWSFFGGEDGDGDLVETTYDLDDCDAIRLECGLDLDITLGGEQRVVLVMDANLVDSFSLEARGGVLVIDAADDPRPSKRARLEMTLTALRRVDIEGAGDVDVRDYHGEELTISVDGAGDLDLDGEVGRLVIEVDGAGDIDARDLRARQATVQVDGAGDVEFHASESADVTINGVGDVDVHGDPVRLEKAVHGLGSIARK